MSYTDQASIEAFLKRDLTGNEETLLPLILSSIDSFINDQVGGSFGEAEESTRYYDGGSKIIDIDPCIEITAVELVDREEDVDHTYVLNEDFEARPRNDIAKEWIEKRIGCFPSGVANIGVTAKFTISEEVPEDIKYLATYLAGQLFSQNVQGNLKSESIEGYSRTFANLIQDNQVLYMTLNKYKKDDIVL